jgi:hypothetical protein
MRKFIPLPTFSVPTSGDVAVLGASGPLRRRSAQSSIAWSGDDGLGVTGRRLPLLNATSCVNALVSPGMHKNVLTPARPGVLEPKAGPNIGPIGPCGWAVGTTRRVPRRGLLTAHQNLCPARCPPGSAGIRRSQMARPWYMEIVGT